MKICGCNSCRRNGEVNPHELFELYLEQRELEQEKDFDNIFLASYNVGEINDLYEELEPKFNSDIVNRINQYSAAEFNAYNYWLSYGGSLSAFERLQKGIEFNGD